MSLRYGFLSLMLLILILVPFSLSANTVKETDSEKGIIVDLKGEVSIHRKSGRFDAYESCKLLLDDTIKVAGESRCGGIAPGSEWFELVGPGTMVLSRRKSGFEDWLERQLDDFIGGKRLHRMITRSAKDWDLDSELAAPILPVNGEKVRVSRSEFYWHSIPGVMSYRVTLVDDKDTELIHTVRENRLLISDLNPGVEYSWKVDPLIDGWNPVSEWRSFQVLTVEEEKMLDDSVKGLTEIQAGVLLIVSGLYGDAIERFDLAIESGESSRSAIIWRARALAAAGLYSDAYENLMIILKED